MSPVDSHYGRFSDVHFEEVRLEGEPFGVQMVLSFLPGRRVNATKIAFVQVARTIRAGAVFTSRGRTIDEAETL